MAVLAAMNLKQVQNAINQFAEKDIIRMSRSAVGRGATRFKTRVKQSVPKESGELRKSIRTKRANGRDKFDPIRIVYSKIGYYNTLLYGFRDGYTYGNVSVNGHKVANPKGNWWDIASKRYAKEYKQNITEFLRENIRRDAAKAYSKTATSKFRGR